MPMNFGPSMPADMPPDLLAAAEESDGMIGGELTAVIPPFEKPVGPKVLNALAKAVAQAAKVMGMEVVPETYTEAVTELDPDIVRFLAMFSAAAEDYGKPLPVSLDAIKDEAGLTALTAALIGLSKDKGFSDFLDMPAEGETMATEAIEEVMPEREEEGMSPDDLFKSRMRPAR